MSELQKLQEVTASLREKLDAANLQIDEMKKRPDYGHWSTAQLALKATQKDLEAANRLNDEYRRFVEQMVNTINPDTAYHWLERARFSLKAMEKPVEVCHNCLRNIRCDVHPPVFEKRKCECIPGVHKPCPEHGFPAMRPVEGPGSVDE